VARPAASLYCQDTDLGSGVGCKEVNFTRNVPVTSQLRHGAAVGAVTSRSWLIGNVVRPSKGNRSFKLRDLKLKTVRSMQNDVVLWICCIV